MQIKQEAKEWFRVFCVLWPAWVVIAIPVIAIVVFDFGSGVREWRRQVATSYSVIVDKGTGCQYMARGEALTPRLDRDGKHICNGHTE